MKLRNFEIGVQRLYYALWACWTGGFLVGGPLEVYNDWTRFQSLPTFSDLVIWSSFGIVLPPALMFTVRWIYRGFIPATAQ